MTSTCAGASIVSSAAPAHEPARKDYYRLCDSWVRARETACFVVWGFPFLFFSFLFGKNLVSTFLPRSGRQRRCALFFCCSYNRSCRCPSQAPKQEALRIKCQAKDAKRCGERRHLYVTDRPSAEWQAVIARYLAKRGYQCRYEQRVPCDAHACKRLHDGIAVYW